ncbi:HAD phosphatase [Phlebopus sp. FC_14]|nr:HAD phosphatase [Phlebopus sp. FC_14]
MPVNIPAILVPFQLIWNPRLILPHVVQDIRQLDFLALRKAGYRGAVFDKDNCLTIPYEDRLVPELQVCSAKYCHTSTYVDASFQSAWRECRDAFGDGNVLIVSNSAGTKHDPGEVQAESVSYHLSVPVLRHNSPKPAYSCIYSIRAYFASLRDPIKDDELVVVGDRIFTDVVMANRMRRRFWPVTAGVEEKVPTQPRETLAVWTDGVWRKENMAMRWMEKRLVDMVMRWTDESDRWSLSQEAFIKPAPPPPSTESVSPLSRLWTSLWRRK